MGSGSGGNEAGAEEHSKTEDGELHDGLIDGIELMVRKSLGCTNEGRYRRYVLMVYMANALMEGRPAFIGKLRP